MCIVSLLDERRWFKWKGFYVWKVTYVVGRLIKQIIFLTFLVLGSNGSDDATKWSEDLTAVPKLRTQHVHNNNNNITIFEFDFVND